MPSSTASSAEWTPRQTDVLEAVLRLLVEEGDRLTMTAVARRASCSKETLYKWFGDRDGLLTATVRWQASRVTVAAVDRERLDLAALTARLEEFAANWLAVISTDTSIALNRVAIAQGKQESVPGARPGAEGAGRAATSGHPSLGAIVLENGRFALGRRMKPVLEAGRSAGLIDFEDAEETFRSFFGLVARDVQIRLLLGDRIDMNPAVIRADAARAARQFLALHRANPARKSGH